MNNYEVKLEKFDHTTEKMIKTKETVNSKSYNFNAGFANFYDDNENMVASYPSEDIVLIRKNKIKDMKKLLLMMFVLASMISIAQKEYHLDIETTLINKEVNLNDGKYHILTEEMLSPFKTEIIIEKSVMLIDNQDKEINLHLQKVESINYHFEDDFYYNPIIYKF